MEILVIIILAVVGYYVYRHHAYQSWQDKFISAMTSQKNFHPALYQIMAKYSAAIGIDDQQHLICIVYRNLNPFYFTRTDIHDVEILMDRDVYHVDSFYRKWSSYFLLRTFGDKSMAEVAAEGVKEKVLEKFNTIQLKVGVRNARQHTNHYLDFLVNGTIKHKRMIMKDIYDWKTRIETL